MDNYNWINFHGKISNTQIVEEFSKSDFWLYPNVNSHETFCISCIEAMCGGNVVITRDFSALPNLVEDNGILIPKELEGEELKNFVIKKVDYILSNNLKEEYQNKAHNRALKFDWNNISKQWLDMLE
jgi:glycosyltransferase involved in cell wall biosynthesis